MKETYAIHRLINPQSCKLIVVEVITITHYTTYHTVSELWLRRLESCVYTAATRGHPASIPA